MASSTGWAVSISDAEDIAARFLFAWRAWQVFFLLSTLVDLWTVDAEEKDRWRK